MFCNGNIGAAGRCNNSGTLIISTSTQPSWCVLCSTSCTCTFCAHKDQLQTRFIPQHIPPPHTMNNDSRLHNCNLSSALSNNLIQLTCSNCVSITNNRLRRLVRASEQAACQGRTSSSPPSCGTPSTTLTTWRPPAGGLWLVESRSRDLSAPL